MEGVFEHFDLKVGERRESSGAALSAFEFLRKNDPIYALRAAMDGMAIYDGKYIRLSVNGKLMMTDTDMEKSSNRGFCIKANGRVLIAGLGIGLIVKNILPKLEDGIVSEIVIIEKYKGVIELVGPYFKHEKIRIIQADIDNWRPAKGEKFDTIYFDIWPEISTDNLKHITFLHNSFKGFVNRKNPNCYMNSWMKEQLQKEKRRRY